MESHTMRNRAIILRTLAVLLLVSNPGLVNSEGPVALMGQSTSFSDVEQNASCASGGECRYDDRFSMNPSMNHGNLQSITAPSIVGSNSLFINGHANGSRNAIIILEPRYWVDGGTSIKVTKVEVSTSSGEHLSGTMGSEYFYGNPDWTRYETDNPTPSHGPFNTSGRISGVSNEIDCISLETQWAYPAKSYPFLRTIFVQDTSAAACFNHGGIRFAIGGSTSSLRVLISNVGVCGYVEELAIERSGSGNWISARHIGWSENWGQYWQLNGVQDELFGQALSFRVTLLRFNKCIVCKDVAPANWQFGETYECGRRTHS